MRIRNATIILILGFALQLMISCFLKRKCDDPRQCQYSRNLLKTFNIDNAGPIPAASEADTLSKEAFGLLLSITLQPAICKANSVSLFSEAHAGIDMWCTEVMYSAKDTILSLVVTALNDYDGQPAGANVSDDFKVLKAFNTTPSYITISAFLKQPQYKRDLIADGETIDLYLLTPPTVAGMQQFKVDITLSDNRVLTSTAKAIYLK